MKKALSLLLALILCLSLCACGGGNTDASNPTNSKVDNPNTDTNDTTGNTTDSKEELYTAVIENQTAVITLYDAQVTEIGAKFSIEGCGLYGEVGSDFADETAIKLLLPNKLCNQICFKTAKSINCLKFLKSMVEL